MGKSDSVSIGNCGEYFVAAELERNGYTAAVPMSNTRDFDILAIGRESGRQIAIQVKTNHTGKRTWTLSQKNEEPTGENTYFVFVCLNGKDAPDYYILPAALVAQSVKKSHADWLGGVDKNGASHKDTPIRKFSFENPKYNPLCLQAGAYKGKWELLGAACDR